MDPFTALIIAGIFAKFFVEKSVVDVAAMITGKEPPSHKYQMAKLEAAKAAGQPVLVDQKGPIRTLLDNWIADTCEDVDSWRVDRRKTRPERKAAKEQRKEERNAKIKEVFGADEKREAEEIDVPDLPKVEEVDPWTPPVVDETARERWAEDSSSGRPWRADDDDYWGATPVDESRRVDSGPDETRDDIPVIADSPEEVKPTQPEADSPEEVKPTQPEADSPEETERPKISLAKDEETRPKLTLVPNTGDEIETEIPSDEGDTDWRPFNSQKPIDPKIIQGKVETIEEDQGAAILPFPVKEEGTEMTAQNGTDVGGLNPHIRWTGEVAAWEKGAIVQAERVQAQMNAGGVGHVTQALVAEIQEAHAAQARRYAQLRAYLAEQKKVQDAYNATKNEAGDKTYLLTGQ